MKIKLQFLFYTFFLLGINSFAQKSINEQWNVCLKKYEAKEYLDVVTMADKIIANNKTPKNIKTEVFLLQGDAYFELEMYKKAIKNYEVAFDDSPGKEQVSIAKDIAHVYIRLKKNKKAIVWFNKEYDLALSLQLPKKAINAKLTIAKLHSNFGNYAAAEKEIAIAQKLSNENNKYKSTEILSISDLIVENKVVDEELTSSFEKEKKQQKDKFIDEILIDKAKSIADIEKLSKEKQLIEYKIKAQADKYEKRLLKEQLKTLEKEQELALNKAQLEMTNATLREEKAQNEKKRAQIIGSLIALSLLIVVIVILIILYRFKQKKNEEILTQKNDIEKKAKHIEDSIQYSQKIQQAILPTKAAFESIFAKSFIYLRSKEKVSGDFFWCFSIGNYSYAAAVDCTGHGVPGAFMTIVCKQILDEIIIDLKTPLPNEILELASKKITNLFAKYNKSAPSIVTDGMDLSLFRYNQETKTLHHSGARNSIYLVRKGILTEFKGIGRSVGLMPLDIFIKPFANNVLQINKGDRVFLFSDGFPDQKGGVKKKKYYYKPFRNLILEGSKVEIEKQKELLNIEFDNWIGNNEQVDDVLILGIEF